VRPSANVSLESAFDDLMIAVLLAIFPAVTSAESPGKPGHVIIASGADGSCTYNGRRYQEGVRVAVSPGPRHLTATSIYLICRGGRLCFHNGTCMNSRSFGNLGSDQNEAPE
jgi:hypothetical protein